MLGPTSLSDVLGYASIACWLGAQFPQVVENIRRQSADGLALPFLLNWALGDATNLIGCILTHQLPFQTWLATYFCFVDLTLLVQFFYYRYSKHPPLLSTRTRAASTATRRMSIEREATHYRALSNVAANVAAAAALAAEQEEYSRWRRHSFERLPNFAVEPSEALEDDNVSEEALARLADSFHSEGGHSGRRKKVAWSQERRAGSLGRSRQSTASPPGRMHASLHMTIQPSQTEEFDPAMRGRPLSRGAPEGEDDAEWSASRRRSSRASRKGASMVFLGVWALFGIGTLAGDQRNLMQSSGLRRGRILTTAEMVIPNVADAVHVAFIDTPNHTDHAAAVSLLVRATEPADHANSEQPERSTEFIIGRISAWVCTTLYLTSRLPQIWKNFVRKSVEGLSMYLFIFAFLGNLFYVASILTSPNLGLPEPKASAFITESIPYLLGSGGTLMFDVTIVTQSFLYRPKGMREGGEPRARYMKRRKAC